MLSTKIIILRIIFWRKSISIQLLQFSASFGLVKNNKNICNISKILCHGHVKWSYFWRLLNLNLHKIESCMKILQIIQLYYRTFLGIHWQILVLKFFSSLVHLSSERTKSQMTGPKYLMELEPFQTVFNLGIWNSLFLQKLYVFFCLINKPLEIL